MIQVPDNENQPTVRIIGPSVKISAMLDDFNNGDLDISFIPQVGGGLGYARAGVSVWIQDGFHEEFLLELSEAFRRLAAEAKKWRGP